MLDCFSGKRVIITGHTGFKGSWLSVWLKMLGADVTGIALDPITSPSHFQVAGLETQLTDHRIDIRDFAALDRVIKQVAPEFIFHLAAQPLVRDSYVNPIDTYAVNMIGTVHVLDSLRTINKECIAVFITSDK